MPRGLPSVSMKHTPSACSRFRPPEQAAWEVESPTVLANQSGQSMFSSSQLNFSLCVAEDGSNISSPLFVFRSRKWWKGSRRPAKLSHTNCKMHSPRRFSWWQFCSALDGSWKPLLFFSLAVFHQVFWYMLSLGHGPSVTKKVWFLNLILIFDYYVFYCCNPPWGLLMKSKI